MSDRGRDIKGHAKSVNQYMMRLHHEISTSNNLNGWMQLSDSTSCTVFRQVGLIVVKILVILCELFHYSDSSRMHSGMHFRIKRLTLNAIRYMVSIYVKRYNIIIHIMTTFCVTSKYHSIKIPSLHSNKINHAGLSVNTNNKQTLTCCNSYI